ncbi:hypothetical protein DdX_21859 [Ditylenchus destructor]|uniref:Uncharacterized protein n=1 Tax=Ditylenchus destructor TaxID=166010 RepID=A0AAD4QUW2_9BILA|nr:hypothetical protein DdX_21859 [Ditylenchus destructor]
MQRGGEGNLAPSESVHLRVEAFLLLARDAAERFADRLDRGVDGVHQHAEGLSIRRIFGRFAGRRVVELVGLLLERISGLVGALAERAGEGAQPAAALAAGLGVLGLFGLHRVGRGVAEQLLDHALRVADLGRARAGFLAERRDRLVEILRTAAYVAERTGEGALGHVDRRLRQAHLVAHVLEQLLAHLRDDLLGELSDDAADRPSIDVARSETGLRPPNMDTSFEFDPETVGDGTAAKGIRTAVVGESSRPSMPAPHSPIRLKA